MLIVLIVWGMLVFSEINTQINNVGELNKVQNEVVEEKEKILDRRFEHLGKYSEIFKDVKRDDTLEKFSDVLDALANKLLIQAVNDKADIPCFLNFSLFDEDELKKLLRNDLQNKKIKDLKEDLYIQLKDDKTRELLDITDGRKDIDIDKTIEERVNKKYPLYNYKETINITVGGCNLNGKITNINERNIYIDRVKYPKDQLSEDFYKYFWKKEHDDFIKKEIGREKVRFYAELEKIVNQELNELLQKYIKENLVRNIFLNGILCDAIKSISIKDIKDENWLSVDDIKDLLKSYLIKCFKGDIINMIILKENEEKIKKEREKADEENLIAEIKREEKLKKKKREEERLRREEERSRQEEERRKQEEEHRKQEEEKRKKEEEFERCRLEYLKFVEDNPSVGKNRIKQLINELFDTMQQSEKIIEKVQYFNNVDYLNVISRLLDLFIVKKESVKLFDKKYLNKKCFKLRHEILAWEIYSPVKVKGEELVKVPVKVNFIYNGKIYDGRVWEIYVSPINNEIGYRIYQLQGYSLDE